MNWFFSPLLSFLITMPNMLNDLLMLPPSRNLQNESSIFSCWRFQHISQCICQYVCLYVIWSEIVLPSCSLFVYIYLSVHLSYLSCYLPTYLSVCLSFCSSVYQSSTNRQPISVLYSPGTLRPSLICPLATRHVNMIYPSIYLFTWNPPILSDQPARYPSGQYHLSIYLPTYLSIYLPGTLHPSLICPLATRKIHKIRIWLIHLSTYLSIYLEPSAPVWSARSLPARSTRLR